VAEIASSKNAARKNYDSDQYTPYFRIYTNGSGLHNRITVSTISYNAIQIYVLNTIDDAQVYHSELAGIKQTTRILLKDLTNPNNLTPKTAVIYSDNQAALRALMKENPTKN
jgi:hypothetical protein